MILRVFFGIIVLLHGLVHLWFVALAQQWFPYEPEMGWTGESWLFTPLIGDAATRMLSSGLYVLVTLAFVVGAIGMFAQAAWWQTLLVFAAACSTFFILLFFDGKLDMIVQKGLIAVLINAAILVALLVFNWPAASV